MMIENNPSFVWSQERNNIHCLFLAYKIEVDSLNFTKSDEAEELRFFSKEELESIKLHKNLHKFKELF